MSDSNKMLNRNYLSMHEALSRNACYCNTLEKKIGQEEAMFNCYRGILSIALDIFYQEIEALISAS